MSVEQEEGGRRRKTYALTEEGRAALATWAEDATWTPPQMRDEAILKMFAGGDPAALLEPRRSWHREKLAELEGYLEAVRGQESWRGSELVLIAGIAYHRKMLEMLDELDPSV
jgi:DNA-binding PadR family transcriptional regulator